MDVKALSPLVWFRGGSASKAEVPTLCCASTRGGGVPFVLEGGAGVFVFRTKYGHKIKYVLVRALFDWHFVTSYCHWLRNISSTFCRRLKLEKYYSLAELLCQICLFEFIRVKGAWSSWNILRGCTSYKSLGSPVLRLFVLIWYWSKAKPDGLTKPRVLYLYANVFSAGQVTENTVNNKNTATADLYAGPEVRWNLKEHCY
jgi:hypothetical protein